MDNKDALFKAILGLDSLKSKGIEPAEIVYYDPEVLGENELNYRLSQLRDSLKVMSFKTRNPDLNDFFAYVMLKLDDFENRLNQMETKQCTD